MSESTEEQALRIWLSCNGKTNRSNKKKIIRFAERLLAEQGEPVAKVTYSNWNGMNVDMLPSYPAVLPVGTLLYAAPPAQAPQGMVMDKLIHFREYWNGNRNDGAMWDALNHIMEELDAMLAAAPAAPAEDGKLHEACKWIINDANYKAPEQIGEVAIRWINRLCDAMRESEEGK